MNTELIILVLLIATALAFDFTNGFHDTGNAMATSIATGALKPKLAVLLAGVLNLVGAFLSVEVAVTVTTSVLKVQDSDTGRLLPGIDASTGLTIIFAGLIGGILWNLLTWLFGIPSSSSHALFGGLIGAGLAALGFSGVNWPGVTQKVLIPAVAAPLIAGLVAACGTWLVYRITRRVPHRRREQGFRWGQIATASLVALSHGTNDAQKTMGVIALALITSGHLTGDVKEDGLPIWIIARLCTGHRAGHLHRRLAGDPHPGQGLGGDRVTAGPGRRGILGGDHPELQRGRHGAVDHPRRHRLDPGQRRRQKPGAQVRWAVAGRMATAWLVTSSGGRPRRLVVPLAVLPDQGHHRLPAGRRRRHLLILVGLSFYMWWRAQQQKVDHNNVNADWDENTNSVVPAGAPEATHGTSKPRTPSRSEAERTPAVHKPGIHLQGSAGARRRPAGDFRHRAAGLPSVRAASRPTTAEQAFRRLIRGRASFTFARYGSPMVSRPGVPGLGTLVRARCGPSPRACRSQSPARRRSGTGGVGRTAGRFGRHPRRRRGPRRGSRRPERGPRSSRHRRRGDRRRTGPRSSRHGRRRWIEVRGLSGPDADDIADAVLEAVRATPGVLDAVINRSVARVVVTVAPDAAEPDLAAIVDGAERKTRTRTAHRHRPLTLPGDDVLLLGGPSVPWPPRPDWAFRSPEPP